MDSFSIILTTLICSAFFSGMEIAFISSNKLKIELELKQGFFSARITSFFVKYPSRFIGTMLVGNNLSLVVYGLVMAGLLEPWIEQHIPEAYRNRATIIILQTFISTLFILVTAEFLPKVLFRINPNKTLNFFALPLIVIYYLLYPVVYLVIGFSEFVLKKFFGVEFFEDKPVFGKIDLDHYIREVASKTQGQDGSTEIQIFQKALDFTKVKVRECMVPRTEIIGMNVNESMDNLRKAFIETGLSKILIFEGNIDHIIGFTHSYEMFRNPDSIRSILLPISIVPETMPANELLAQLTKQHKSIALVLDEFGVTAGMLTLEDVIEEIFGEIEDEHDVDALVEKQLSDNEFVFSGRTEIDYINSKYHLDIPVSENYETMAGFIFHNHERIPHYNEVIQIPPFSITILSVSNTRIERVKVKKEKA